MLENLSRLSYVVNAYNQPHLPSLPFSVHEHTGHQQSVNTIAVSLMSFRSFIRMALVWNFQIEGRFCKRDLKPIEPSICQRLLFKTSFITAGGEKVLETFRRLSPP